MDPNTHSTQRSGGLGRLAAVVDELAAEDLDAQAARLHTAMTLLPPVLGGAPTQPLEVGRATRVVSPAQRSALTVRDGGCRFPSCDRPVAWCEGHHLVHWVPAAPPTWRSWCCCAAATTMRCTRAAGSCTVTPTGP